MSLCDSAFREVRVPGLKYSDMHLNVCSRHKNQTTFSGQTILVEDLKQYSFDGQGAKG